MNKHKKFIKEAYEGKHGTMCQDWKDTILEHYPEFNEKKLLEIGKWYVNTGFKNVIIRVCEPVGNKVKSYGFEDCVWFDHRGVGDFWGYMDEDGWREATTEEIESHLIEEAERMGFVKGVRIKYHADELNNPRYIRTNSLKIDSYSVKYFPGNDILQIDAAVVYCRGQWAEIINTMTKEEAEKKLNCKIV